MIDFIYIWLPRVFGCHCRDDRSFHFKGRRFPICARCTGELAGIIAAALLYRPLGPSYLVSALMLIPLILDGGIQYFTSYESTNVRRLITGILFGAGLTFLFIRSVSAAFRLGVRIGHSLF